MGVGIAVGAVGANEGFPVGTCEGMVVGASEVLLLVHTDAEEVPPFKIAARYKPELSDAILDQGLLLLDSIQLLP